jgi:hypothetical protein
LSFLSSNIKPLRIISNLVCLLLYQCSIYLLIEIILNYQRQFEKGEYHGSKRLLFER